MQHKHDKIKQYNKSNKMCCLDKKDEKSPCCFMFICLKRYTSECNLLKLLKYTKTIFSKKKSC